MLTFIKKGQFHGINTIAAKKKVGQYVTVDTSKTHSNSFILEKSTITYFFSNDDVIDVFLKWNPRNFFS
jgi:hypothetical protein